MGLLRRLTAGRAIYVTPLSIGNSTTRRNTRGSEQLPFRRVEGQLEKSFTF